MKVTDLIEVLPVEPVAPIWHGCKGVITNIVGKMSPFLYTVKVTSGGEEYELVLRDNEMEVVGK